MTTGQNLLPEFNNEMAGTRKTLERIPGDKLDWKIHEKSNTIGWVATHLANLPSWATMTIETGSLDVAPKDGEPFTMPGLIPSLKFSKGSTTMSLRFDLIWKRSPTKNSISRGAY